MRTGIAAAIFLVSVALTLLLYYFHFIRKGGALEFIESHTTFVLSSLAVLIFLGILLLGIKATLLFLAFLLLYYILLYSR
jgi:hypothetical protein